MINRHPKYNWNSAPLDGTLTATEIANILGCHVDTVRKYCRRTGGKTKLDRGWKPKKRVHTEQRSMKPGHDPTIAPELRPLEGLSGWMGK